MRVPLSWLKQHLDTAASVMEIGERLTMIGLEVEAIEDRAAALEGFVAAEIVDAQPHPNADKLQVCTVDTGGERLQVVCGAANARAGLKSVFAPVGTVIPASGTALKPAAIRGVESCGMLVSLRELQLADDHEGIIELAADTASGTAAAVALGLADPVIVIGITPNRGDCLAIRGVARDLAAAGLGRLQPLETTPVEGRFPCPIGVRLDFGPADADACPFFAGRLIRGVRNAESPRWLRERLEAVGLRPISALVDITNYLTFDLARPLHVFDADKLSGSVHVRLGRPEEPLAALNGKAYTLDAEMTVVADDAGAQALGGIIGGDATGCREETQTVFVESALFDPVRTAATGRALSVTSDARYRFERGIDPALVVPGLEIATRLILEVCGGEASELVLAGTLPPPRRPIVLPADAVVRLTGVEAGADEVRDVLGTLGFTVAATNASEAPGALAVTPPSWRNDIAEDGSAVAGLVEEIVRILGYHRIPVLVPGRDGATAAPALSARQARRGRVRRLLAERGLIEAVTYSFVSARAAEPFGAVPASLRLVNPISADLDVMRPSLLPNLLQAAQRNAHRGLRDAALFEIGPQYSGDRPDQQTLIAAAIRCGRSGDRHWAQPVRPVDVFDAKADALAALEVLGVRGEGLQVTPDAPPWYHPGRSGTLRLGPKLTLACFGEIHPRVLRALDVEGPAVACEVFVEAAPLKAATGSARPALRLSALQPVERDFAFLVDRAVTAAAIVAAARGADRALVAEARVFDVFQGAGLEPDKKSIALGVVLAPQEKTLTDAEIEAVGARIIDAVGKATGAVLRG